MHLHKLSKDSWRRGLHSKCESTALQLLQFAPFTDDVDGDNDDECDEYPSLSP
jgi:hypothetical protein